MGKKDELTLLQYFEKLKKSGLSSSYFLQKGLKMEKKNGLTNLFTFFTK